ncbi:MAG: glycoside hydrolase family 38 N-terminal domain-containing protein [Candidatus Humimicrobiaceae bacterium]
MKFQWAVCQHPMTLIIKEDETALERIPPFGAESFHAYYLKIKENLEYIKSHKFIKVCFETSILETLFVLDDYPEIKKDFLQLLDEKRISFVGGTYGQAHLQTLSSESNYRQLEEGLRKYKELFDTEIKLYAVQEPGHHEQVPQLLRAFNIKFTALPTFTYSLVFLEPYELVSFMEMAWMRFTKERGMEQDQITRICFTKNYEFARWVGLDKSEIPLYLIDPMRWCRREDIRNEYKKDLCGSPTTRLYLTDLLDFNPEIVKETLENSEFTLADEAIEKRYKELSASVPKSEKGPGPLARLYSYYSYLEGSNCDKAYIENRKLENLIIKAQALDACLALNDDDYITSAVWDEFWKIVLETQHHDVCYIDAPNLQVWALGKITQCKNDIDLTTNKLKESLQKYLSKDLKGKMPGHHGSIVLFNPKPHDMQFVAEVEIPADFDAEDLILKGPGREDVDFQITQENKVKKIVFTDGINGFGIRTLSLGKREISGNKKISGSKNTNFKKGKIDTRFYACDVNESGEISNIYNKGNRKTIFRAPANKLSACFNSEIPIEFKADIDKFKHKPGIVFDTVFAEGGFDKSFYKKEIKFYKGIPRIDFKIMFDFKDQQIGNVFLEETKLCMTWPAKGLKKISHDIPFGVVEGMKSRPLYCLNWINCELEDDTCFTLFSRGKIKYFEKDGILYNLLGWGDEGVDFMRVGGTSAPEILQGHFDLKLNGIYDFEYSLLLHDKKPLNSELFKMAASYDMILTDFYYGEDLDIREDIVFGSNNKNIITTGVFIKDDKVDCRFFECDGKNSRIDFKTKKGIKIEDIREISGERISTIKPYKIAQGSISKKYKKT